MQKSGAGISQKYILSLYILTPMSTQMAVTRLKPKIMEPNGTKMAPETHFDRW